METSKKWYSSKTVWGGVAVLASAALQAAGYDVNSDDLSGLVDLSLTFVATASEFVGAALVIYGRIKASKRIE